MLSAYVTEPKRSANVAIIWMHGLGATAMDMSGLADQLMLTGKSVRHVFLNAPVQPVTINNGVSMPAWYDVFGFNLSYKEDKQGILASEAKIRTIIRLQTERGVSPEQVYLAGFSQGGAMALYTGLNYFHPLGGVIALSAYMPLALECQPILCRSTPIFLGFGTEDTIVLPDWSKATRDWLLRKGYPVTSHSYPMQHSICAQEVQDLSTWFAKVFNQGARP